jgi:hypothetical protein
LAQGGTIAIRAEVVDAGWRLTVSNPTGSACRADGMGLGLANLRQRLALLCAGADLAIRQLDGSFEVSLVFAGGAHARDVGR